MKNFQITPTTTTISSITTKETVDVPTLNKLISSDLLKETFNNKYQAKIFKNELKQLMEYKKMISFSESNDGFIYIDMKKNNRYGRSHARLSLLQIRKEIRQSITKDLYTDVDIENCHVVILQQICKKNKVETPKLDDYINNREMYLEKIMTDYSVNRDDAKRVFLVAMYCGNFLLEGDEPDYYKELVAETRSIAKLITSQNPDIKSMVEMMKEDEQYISNLNGKVLSHYLQEFEHIILDEVFKYCTDKKYIIDNNCSLQADGIMIPKVNMKASLLNELSKHIKKTVGFNLKFTEKEMKQHYCDIVDDHIINFVVPKIERELPKLTQSPNVVGNNKYLSNIFTQEMYDKHKTIILESCCGTGKTYSVVKYISNLASKNDVVLSIINRKSY
jgi:Rad3-related DNA helicase